MNKRQFKEYIIPILKDWGCTIQFEQSGKLPENLSGFFDSESMTLAVAMKHKNSFDVMVHEYCHFEQCVLKPVFWEKMSDGHGRFFEWLDTKRPVSREVLKWKNMAQYIEYDCEVRALKLIDTLGLEIDKKIYCQKANAYLLSYHFICTHRKWPEKGCMYADRISKLLPTKLLPFSKIKDEKYVKDDVINEMTKLFV